MKICFKNALIVDGSGRKPFKSDILVENDVIKEIKHKITGIFDQEIDLKGKFLTPGFIDMHSHAELGALSPSLLAPKLHQGITTEVSGQCGLGVAPISKELQNDFREKLVIGDISGDWSWESMPELFSILENKGLESNLINFVGHGVLRYSVKKESPLPLSKNEMFSMKRKFQESIDAGASGLSFGMIYLPAIYSDQNEIKELMKEASKNDLPVSVHLRSESDEIIKALSEFVRLANETKTKLHISHLKVIGKRNWHKIDKILSIIDKEKLSFDFYPYIGGSTTMLSLIPPPILKKYNINELNKSYVLKKIEKYIKEERFTDGFSWDNIPSLVNWDKIYINDLNKNKQLVGKSLLEVAEAQKQDPLKFMVNLLVEEKGNVQMIDYFMNEEVLEKIIAHPNGVLSSDSILSEKPHPRNYGAFPKFLRKYVFEKKILTIEQAIHKMTGKSAKILNIKDRGLIKKNYKADFAVFDDDFKDKSSFAKPCQLAIGLDYLLVNGKFKIIKDNLMTVKAGKILKTNKG